VRQLGSAGRIPWSLDFGSCKGVGPAIVEPLRRRLGFAGSYAEGLDYDVWIVLDPDRIHHDALPHIDERTKDRIGAAALQSSIPLSRAPGYDYRALYPEAPHGGSLDSRRVDESFDSSFDAFGLYYFPWPGNPEYQSFLSPLERVTDEERLFAFPMPSITDDAVALFEEDLRFVHQRGKLGAAWSGSLYELSWYLRGRERIFLDYYDDPRLVDSLVEKIAGFVEELTRKNLEAGVDVLCFYDDLGTQSSTAISPAVFRRFYKPHYKRIWGKVKSFSPDRSIFLHSCGAITSLVPDLIECGLDILNPIQPEAMDVSRIFREYGGDLGFWGTIGVQSTFCDAGRKEIFDVVGRRINELGPGGALVLGPANTLGKDVPLDNVVSFIEACQQLCRR
jgi:uroporphyrinogen decarboxylase